MKKLDLSGIEYFIVRIMVNTNECLPSCNEIIVKTNIIVKSALYI